MKKVSSCTLFWHGHQTVGLKMEKNAMFFCEIFFNSSTSNAKKYVSFSIGGSKGVLSLNCTFCDFFAYCIIKFLYFIHEINFTKNIFFFFSENFFFVNSISRNFFYVYNLNNLTNVSMSRRNWYI